MILLSASASGYARVTLPPMLSAILALEHAILLRLRQSAKDALLEARDISCASAPLRCHDDVNYAYATFTPLRLMLTLILVYATPCRRLRFTSFVITPLLRFAVSRHIINYAILPWFHAAGHGATLIITLYVKPIRHEYTPAYYFSHCHYADVVSPLFS